MEKINWRELISRLDSCVRFKTTPIGLKRFKTESEMLQIPKVRRVKGRIHTICQYAGMAFRLNHTVGFTRDQIFGTQCQPVLGMHERTEHFLEGEQFVGVWYETIDDTRKHQAYMKCADFGDYEAAAFAPLVNGRLDPPEVCLIYLNPGQMIYFINGLQYRSYEPLEASVVGESSCSDTWGNALRTGKPSLSLNCFAERRYGGVLDEELLIALRPEDLIKAVDGMEQLSRNGLRYPYAPYGLQMDCTEGMGVSYQ